MSAGILLKGRVPKVDRGKIGISYSGGGGLVLVELGIARAFVELGIVPAVIAGATAGALAGTAHALDVRKGTGIDMAVDVLGRVSNRFLGLDHLSVFERLISQRSRTTSLGDNHPIGQLVRDGFAQSLGLRNVTLGTFTGPDYPELMLVATGVTNGEALWFSAETPIEDALIASSAIPGVFPWRTMTKEGTDVIVVDGGVVSNQPLSNLVDEGCGTIYACAVGPTEPLPPPTNALANALNSVHRMMHQSMKLEEEYVRLKLGDRGVVHHIHPDVAFPVHGFDFTPALIERIVADACAKTRAWLSEPHED